MSETCRNAYQQMLLSKKMKGICFFPIQYLNLLIRAGCDASQPDKRQRRTPLMMACILRNEVVADFLIDVRFHFQSIFEQ